MFEKLDAINSCLRGIGLAPLASEDEPDLDGAQASLTIDETSKLLQSKGWWFNIEPNWSMTPDSVSGKVTVPNGIIGMRTGSYYPSGLVMRGKYIHDTLNHTNNLLDRVNSDGVIIFDFIRELEYEEIPVVAQLAIMYKARRVFAQDLEVDSTRYNFQMRDEQDAFVKMEQENSKNLRRNTIRSNARLNEFLTRAGGPNSVQASSNWNQELVPDSVENDPTP